MKHEAWSMKHEAWSMNHEASLLFSLRSRTNKEFKDNFPYSTNRLCPMGSKEEDTPEHCLDCTQLKLEENDVQDILYEDIFSVICLSK